MKLNITTNGALLTRNQQVHLMNYRNIWYHSKDMSNILSMRNVNKKNRIIYDSNNGDRFIVINTRSGGHDMIFIARNDGLYYNVLETQA